KPAVNENRIRLNCPQLRFILCLVISLVWGRANLPAQALSGESPQRNRFASNSQANISRPKSVQWESLGFSADGQYFAGMTYGVEHNLVKAESHFFARLSVLRLRGNNDELVFERILRRSGVLRNGLGARSIMQDLLRRESEELRQFQIEPMELGEVLLFPDSSDSNKEPPSQTESSATENPPIGEAATLPAEGADTQKLLDGLNLVRQVQQLILLQTRYAPNILDRVYMVTQNADTTVFQLQQLRLDGSHSLRGQIVAAQSQGFPHRYSFQRNWNTLLQSNLQSNSELDLRPVFITLSPDGLHLLLTVQIHTKEVSEDVLAEKMPPYQEEAPSMANDFDTEIVLSGFENDDNYAFVTFSIQVY
ncbi:MAG: hypothetical protein AAF975_07335, partial [Spirochaetota bacterium]